MRLSLQKYAVWLALFAAMVSIALWWTLNFHNPYTKNPQQDVMFTSFLWLALPAVLAAAAAFARQAWMMMLAFLWSLPFSLYLSMTPGIFALYGITSIFYFVSYLLFKKAARSKASADFPG